MNVFKRLHLYFWEMRHPVNKSRHLKVYEEIADRHQIDVRKVYQLAHGRHSEDYLESRAVSDLIHCGIIR